MTNTTPEEMVNEAKASVPSITTEEYRAMRDAGEDHILLDVREKDEYDAGHIEGSLHIPRGLVELKIEEHVPNKNTNIVVHCASGGRSALCTQTLMKLGYTNVKNLEGGYKKWAAENA